MRGKLHSRTLPGELGLWVFIFSDLGLFALYFVLAAWDMRADPVTFQQGQASLNLTLGMINTVVLLTGSWAVAMGTRVATDARQAARYLQLAALTGLIFLGVKFFEYDHLVSLDHTIDQNAFYTWYFFLTGFHAFHVVAAVAFLMIVAARYRGESQPGHVMTEAAGCYWHLVDLLWIGIFLVLYLL
jgi:nitric oxide reductase NorE protein